MWRVGTSEGDRGMVWRMLDIVKALVLAGADVAAVNRHTHLTPFLLACRGGCLEVCTAPHAFRRWLRCCRRSACS
jgi:hypothetical protein